MTHLLNIILLSIAVLVSAQAQAVQSSENQFKEVDDLLALGAPGLALRVLEKRQPVLADDNLEAWFKWETKRIQLIQKLQNWPLLVDRVNQLVKDNHDDISWFQTQQIKAYLKLGNHTSALSLLQQLLWNTDEYTGPDIIAAWRRLVIRSYLQMNRVEDAQRAMRRYQQDYGSLKNEDGVQWTILKTQLLMRTRRYKEVIRSLSDARSDEEKAMMLMAKLDANLQPSQQLKRQLEKHLSVQESSKKDRLTNKNIYSFVLLKVALAEKDLKLQIQLIEEFIRLRKTHKVEDVFFDAANFISADSLWAVYESLGYEVANQYRLLRGDDEAWYLKASNLFEEKPVQAKAMYAVLAFNAKKSQHRALAFEQLVKLLDQQKFGIEIINSLFMKSARLSDIESVPVQVRYRLVDYALSRADLKSAAKLMEKLQQPPEGEDAFAWNLRRARILIMGGQYLQGAKTLSQLLIDKKEMLELEIDQTMQVVFDLQAIDQHGLALPIFKKLGTYPLSKKLQREIDFWKAESHQARDEYEQAAYLFLKSATPIDDTFDPWFHTASFKAAESLAQAMLIDDARRQYIKLLRITGNAARQSVIKQRLQQLRLLKNKVADKK
jgi:hypothetical protein